MKKSTLISFALVLLCGIALGFGISQWASCEAPQPAQTSVVTQQAQSVQDAQETQNTQTPSQDSAVQNTSTTQQEPMQASVLVEEDGTYTSKDEVAAYIHEFGHLPSNYISKSKAKKAGWVAKEGNLDEVLPGMSIGGSEFYNDEGLLPDAPGRSWTECDINYAGGYRGSERIVFSNDGLIFYTADHYETFEQLY